MEDSIQKIKEINEEKSAKLLEKAKHNDLVLSNIQTQQVIVQVANSLVEYLDNKENKTEVTNQLTEIGTPDALVVARAVDSLHDTMQGLENTDLSGVTEVMQGILDEAKKIPKELPKEKEQKFIDYTPQLKSLGEAVKAVEKVVKAQKLIAEAPVINVPETNVNVDAPDLKPLQKGLKDVVSAVNKVVIPETSTEEVEKLLKASNKLLKDLLKKPVSSGGGGGGSSWPALGTNGFPSPLNLDSSGNLKIAGTTTVDTTGLATSTKQSDGTQKTQIVDNGGSIAADVLDLTNSNPLTTALVDANGDQITSFGGGTQYTEGDTDASFTGTISLVEGAANAAVTLKQPTQPTDTQPVSATSLPLPTGAATSANQQTDAITDTQLRATPVPVSGTVTATPTGTQNVDVTANTIGLATGTKQDTGNTSLGNIDTKTPALGQALAAASTPVVLTAAQVTTLTPPAAITGFATAANQLPDGHNVTVDNASIAVTGTFFQATQPVSGTVTETNSAAILADTANIDTAIAAINAKMVSGTDIGDVTINNASGANAVNIQDGGNTITVDGTVAATQSGTWTEANSAAIKTAVETLDNAIAGSEMQVDVVGALPAGTNAIGKLSANSGVDIGDVDVTSAVSATFDHGSNRDVDTSAEQITSTSFACKFGVTLKADITNTGILYIGNSDVTAGTTAATDGFPLSAGETLTLEVTNSNIPYAIASANNQIIYWTAV